MFVSTKQRTLSAVVLTLVGAWAAYAHTPARLEAPVGPPVVDTKPVQTVKPGDVRFDPKKDVVKLPLNLIGTLLEFPPADGKGKAAKQGAVSVKDYTHYPTFKELPPLSVQWSSPQIDNPNGKPVMLLYQITTKPVSSDPNTTELVSVLASGTLPTKLENKTEGTFSLDNSVWEKVNWDKAPSGANKDVANIYLRVTPMVDGKPAASASSSVLIVCTKTFYIQ